MNGHSARIAGVLPRSFRFQFPSGGPPLIRSLSRRTFHRLRQPSGWCSSHKRWRRSSPESASRRRRRKVEALEKHLVQAGGREPPVTKVQVGLLQEKLAGGSRRALMVLLAAGTFVLLIAAVLNVANLLLARATVRRKEVAICAAAGAGRMRVMRQLLAESVLLALAGGTAGLLLARWAIAILVRISPYAIPRLAEAAIDTRVLAFTLGVSLLTGILFGAGPAFSLWRANCMTPSRLGRGVRRAPRASARGECWWPWKSHSPSSCSPERG